VTEDVISGLRVSDDERDGVAHMLREAFAVGRLSIDELHERLDRVYTARTRADIDALTVDLPPATAPPPPVARGHRHRRPWAAFVRVNAICWSIWGVTAATAPAHHLEGLWPLWVTVPWGAAMLSRRGRHC
jgi:Domain of unknown function (DUF1707)